MTEAVTHKNVAAALVAAQREFGPALKTKSNPHLRTKYADLSAVIEAVIDALNNNGLMLTQHVYDADNGVKVETIFLHESGEKYSTGAIFVPAPKQDPQGYGSALTYARRYSLLTACGIAPEDDDGQAASRANAGSSEDTTKMWIDYVNKYRADADKFPRACAKARKALSDVRDMAGLKRLNAAIGGEA